MVEKVFISSVFDAHMLSARNVFRNEINAKFNYLLGQFGGNVYLYDFVMGIPEHTDALSVLEICFDKIAESTFFIFMLGQNYGSFVREFLKGADIRGSRYEELIELGIREDLSVLELELIYALQKKKMEKVLVRVCDHTEGVAKEGTGKERADDRAIRNLIKRVKSYGLVFTECQDITEIKTETVRRFAECVMRRYGHMAEGMSIEAANFNLFKADLTRYYLDNEEDDMVLDRYCFSDADHPLGVAGGTGMGKSALLLQWSERFMEKYPDYVVVREFAGTRSHAASEILLSIYRQMLGDRFDELQIDQSIGYEAGCINAFPAALEMASERKVSLLILIDGLEGIEYRGEYQGGFWIPRVLPTGIKMIVSAGEDTDVSVEVYQIPAPDPAALLKNMLESEGKGLEYDKFAGRMEEISRAGLTPQYVRLMFNEIILMADYRTVLSAVHTYFDGTTDIITAYQNYLRRVSCVFHPDTVKKVCQYIRLTKYGLHEEMLIRLVPNEDTADFLNFMYHFLKRNVDHMVKFGSQYLSDAVIGAFPVAEEEERRFRNRIIDVLMDERQGIPKAMEVIHQMYLLGDERIIHMLANIDIANGIYSVNRMLLYEYMNGTGYAKQLLAYWHENIQTIDHELFLSEVCYALGEYQVTLQHYVRRAAYLMDTYGGADQRTYRKHINLAEVFALLGQPEQAEEIYIKYLLKIAGTLGDGHKDTANIYNGYGNVLWRLQREDDALIAYRKSIQCYKISLGEAHPDTAGAIQNLAVILLAKDCCDEAEAYFLQAAQLYRGSLGERHPYYLKALNNIALSCLKTFQYDRALELVQRVLQVRTEVLGKYHVQSGKALVSLGSIYTSMLEFDQAEECLEQALEILGVTVQEDDSLIQTVLKNREVIAQERKILQEIVKTDHEESGDTFRGAGSFLAAKGLFDFAESCFYKAQKLYEADGDRIGTGRVYHDIGVCFSLSGRLKQAFYWHSEAYKERVKVLGPFHVETSDSCMEIGFMYTRLNDHHEALDWYRKAADIREQMTDDDIVLAAESFNNIGGAFFSLSDYENAFEYAGKAHGIYHMVYGPEHPKTLNAANNMTRALQAGNKK